MDGGDESRQMAETLMALAGANAWLAARGFASEAALEGDAAAANHWRKVARAVLKLDTERLAQGARETQSLATGVAEAAEPAATDELADAPAAIAAPSAEISIEQPELPLALPAETGAEAVIEADPAASAPAARITHAPIPLRARRQMMRHESMPIASDAVDAAIAVNPRKDAISKAA